MPSSSLHSLSPSHSLSLEKQGMTLGSHSAAAPPLGCSKNPIHPVPLSPASPKPGETNTVTPSWQVPLGAIQFPRETNPHKAHVPSCAATGNQTMPITLATTAVPSLWFVTTTTVQLTTRKRVALPLLYKLPLIISQEEREKGCCRTGERGSRGQCCRPGGPFCLRVL